MSKRKKIPGKKQTVIDKGCDKYDAIYDIIRKYRTS